MADSAALRKRRERDRQRRGVRPYDGIELADSDLGALIDIGEITEHDALVPRKVAALATRLLRVTIKKMSRCDAAGR